MIPAGTEIDGSQPRFAAMVNGSPCVSLASRPAMTSGSGPSAANATQPEVGVSSTSTSAKERGELRLSSRSRRSASRWSRGVARSMRSRKKRGPGLISSIAIRQVAVELELASERRRHHQVRAHVGVDQLDAARHQLEARGARSGGAPPLRSARPPRARPARSRDRPTRRRAAPPRRASRSRSRSGPPARASDMRSSRCGPATTSR